MVSSFSFFANVLDFSHPLKLLMPLQQNEGKLTLVFVNAKMIKILRDA